MSLKVNKLQAIGNRVCGMFLEYTDKSTPREELYTAFQMEALSAAIVEADLDTGEDPLPDLDEETERKLFQRADFLADRFTYIVCLQREVQENILKVKAMTDPVECARQAEHGVRLADEAMRLTQWFNQTLMSPDDIVEFVDDVCKISGRVVARMDEPGDASERS